MFQYQLQKSHVTRWAAIFVALFGFGFQWFGCGGAGSSNQRGDTVSAGTHEPSQTGLDKLGTLKQVSVPEVAEPPDRTETGTDAKPPSPIRIQEDVAPRPYALNGDKLILPSGLTIHRLPKHTVVRIVTEQQTGRNIWEIVDKRKRRLALLRARSWREVVLDEGQSLTKNTRTTRLRARRSDWGSKPISIIVDRFTSETHVYTLERRAVGSDWIWSRLEIEPTIPASQ